MRVRLHSLTRPGWTATEGPSEFPVHGGKRVAQTQRFPFLRITFGLHTGPVVCRLSVSPAGTFSDRLRLGVD